MQPEWSDTLFGRLVLPRLAKEMSREDIEILHERDGDSPACVNFLAGLQHPPNQDVRAIAYHHIFHRGMGGGSPNVLVNIAPACSYCHQDNIECLKELWQRAMVKSGKAKTSDYPMLDPWLYPPLQECMGLFPYGTGFYATGIPPLIQKLFVPKDDARLDNYCLYVCPVYLKCAEQTRVRKYKEIAK